MKVVILLAILGIVAMSLAIGFAFIQGDFFQEGSRLLSMPWGIVSMIDLYTGFILFSGWIIFREKSALHSVIWVFFMMTLGFFTASVYVLTAAVGSKGNWRSFWMGKRSELG
jgi:hypothetical protein